MAENNQIFFDSKKIDEMTSHYLNEIDSFWEDEEYKWKAVQYFQSHWDIDSEDFEQMFRESTSKHINLLGSGNYFPRRVLLETAKAFPEELRMLFNGLYDENLELTLRIKDFQKGVGGLYQRTSKAGKSNYQDLRAVSVLLWLRYPDKYYVYKSRELNNTFRLLGGNAPKLNGKPECFPAFLDYMNALNAYFLKNEPLKEKISKLLNSSSLYEDKLLHTATIDFVFYAGKRFDSKRINNTSNKSIDNNNIEEMNELNYKLLEEYKYFLLNCTTLKESSVGNYTDFKRLNDCIQELNNGNSSVLDYSDPDAFYHVMVDLENLQSYKDINEGGGNQYSNALKYYLRFLLAKKYFGAKKSSSFIKSNIINKPQQIIYYGAPGTGKSYGIKKKHGITKDNSYRITFHPDTDYSSFVGCYKPTMKTRNSVKRNFTEAQLVQILKEKINDPNLKYPYHKFGFDYWQELSDYKPKDYEEWINQCGGKPSMKVEINDSKTLGEYAAKQINNEISYEFVPQVFTEAYVAAWKGLKEGKSIFLIIEEINRGNCAQIFGDLFQLLDRREDGYSDYEIRPEKDLQVYLAGELGGLNFSDERLKKIPTGEELILPPNLNIIATMNTSDQSLFPIDSAFKRRWNWNYIAIKNVEEMNYRFEVDGILYKWWSFVVQVNNKIKDVTESEDKKIGYFFVHPDKKENESDRFASIITEDNFVSKVLFYLWTDVFKDYSNDVENNIFRLKLSRQEDNGSTKYKPISFTDFFDEDGEVNINILKAFLEQFSLDSDNDEITDDILADDSSSSIMTITVNGAEYDVGGAGSSEKIINSLLTLDIADLDLVCRSDLNTKVLNDRCRLIDDKPMPIDDPVEPSIKANVYRQYRDSMRPIGDTGYYVQTYPPQRRRLFKLLSSVLGSAKFSFIES